MRYENYLIHFVCKLASFEELSHRNTYASCANLFRTHSMMMPSYCEFIKQYDKEPESANANPPILCIKHFYSKDKGSFVLCIRLSYNFNFSRTCDKYVLIPLPLVMSLNRSC